MFFRFKGVVFKVKQNTSGKFVYRDYAHLGGPWSDAAAAIANTSLDITFRKELKRAIELGHWQEEVKVC